MIGHCLKITSSGRAGLATTPRALSGTKNTRNRIVAKVRSEGLEPHARD